MFIRNGRYSSIFARLHFYIRYTLPKKLALKALIFKMASAGGTGSMRQ
jgi:hypothetical protein